MLKNQLLNQLKNAKQVTGVQARRLFSQQIKPPTVNNTGAYVLGGIGLAGLGYLAFTSSQMKRNAQYYQRQGETFFSPTVQNRVAKALAYTGYGIGATAIGCGLLRNSMAALNANPWLLLGGSIALLVGTHMTDYHSAFPLKLGLYTGFCGLTAVTLVPLIQMSAMAVIYDAALATGVSMAALATIAYNAPSEQFLMWGGALSLACGGMLGVSILSMLYPGSAALYNIWLYGGLGLTGALVLFRTQNIIHSAKTQPRFDPINHSIGLYLDAVNMFVRFLMIFGNNRKK